MASPFDRGTRADGGPASTVLSVATDTRSLGLTYEPFYGLREKPFSLTSDARFFYQSRSHAPAFDDLLRAMKRRESLTVLTGDIGTGKTTLCRAVLQNIDQKTFSAFVTDPFASREELLKVLLTDFGVASTDDVMSGRLRNASRTELMYLLQQFLDSLASLQAFAVVFVDEAQNLSLPLLEEMRILSDADGQMQVVLVGQLELDAKLRLPAMRQLDQRVSARCRLQPLDVAGVAGYVSHRLHRAGGSADRVSFSGEAVELIHEISGGVPRVINKLCDRTLTAAYGRKAALIARELVAIANPDHVRPSSAAVTPQALTAAPPAEILEPVGSCPAPTIPVPSASRPAPASDPVSSQSTDPVDQWLDALQDSLPDRRIDAAPLSNREPLDQFVRAPRQSRRGRIRIRVGYAPLPSSSRAVHERVPRKWTRRLELLAFTLVLLLIALMIGPAAWDAGSDTMTFIQEQFEPPALPAVPSRPALHVPGPPDAPPPIGG